MSDLRPHARSNRKFCETRDKRLSADDLPTDEAVVEDTLRCPCRSSFEELARASVVRKRQSGRQVD
jgi:hypothetical protein